MDASLLELLPILRCPERRVPLAVADADTVRRINERIAKGLQRNRAGQVVTEPIEAAFLREGGDVAYPIRESIPVLIVEEGLLLEA
jgi:uncharacterized protein YbaR (Trm112 family)